MSLEIQCVVRFTYQNDWKRLKEAAEQVFEKASSGVKLQEKVHYCVTRFGPPFSNAPPEVYILGVEVIRAFRAANGIVKKELQGAVSIKPWSYYNNGVLWPLQKPIEGTGKQKTLENKKDNPKKREENAKEGVKSMTAEKSTKRDVDAGHSKRKSAFERLPKSLSRAIEDGSSVYRISGLHTFRKISTVCEKHNLMLQEINALVGIYCDSKEEAFTMIIAPALKNVSLLNNIAKDVESSGKLLTAKEAEHYHLEYVGK